MAYYLQGSGTQADPWVIHNPAALKYFFEDGCLVSGYAILACDIDMSGVVVTLKYDKFQYCNLDGYGRRIINLNVSGYYNYLRATWKRIRFISLSSNVSFFSGYNSSESFFVDCEFDGVSVPLHTSYIVFTRCVARNLSAKITNYYAGVGCYVVDGMNLFSGFTNLTSSSDKYNPTNYPALGQFPGLWLIDGSSMPRLLSQSIGNLTHAYVVKGVTKVGGLLKSRVVSAHSPHDFNQIAKLNSSDDGSYTLNCGFYTDHVTVIHRDSYGSKFVQSKSYALGDVIHPSIPNGYRYICTTSGTSAATDPTTWPTSGTLTTGSAIFTPAPVYKPETMLVVPVLIDLVTGLPV